jgi:1-acyl-sn-glycerol-3-phosphate acyltransferase
VIGAASPRPIRFVMDHRIFKTPLLGWIFRTAQGDPDRARPRKTRG